MTWDNGLDDIPWSDLTHAYGWADDVPGLLRNLTSPKEKIRKQAIHELYGNIWHQGTVYEATPHTVPFLIRLHSIPELPAHDDVAILLMLIGAGRGFHEVHTGITPSDGTPVEEAIADERRIRAEIREALLPLLPELSAYRKSTNRDLREVSLELIEANRDYFDDAFSMIETAVSDETDSAIVEKMTEILECWDD